LSNQTNKTEPQEVSVAKDQKALTDLDLANVRQLYGEVQNWTRHYEQLIFNANVLIVSASLIFVGLAFGEKVSRAQSLALLVVPAFMALAGIATTLILFNLYALCIERLIRLESLLGCNDAERMAGIDGLGPLVPTQLHALPVRHPTSVRFFIGLHLLLVAAYVGLAILKGVSGY
jgi:hypothetical protein